MKIWRRRCMAIMPYGTKDVDGKRIDFDLIYEEYIERAIEEAGFLPLRTDQDRDGGPISPKMFQQIFESEVAVADVTYDNPNVYYELGVRHALKKHGTVLVSCKGGDYGIVSSKDEAGNFDINLNTPFDTRDIVHLYYRILRKKKDRKTYINELAAHIVGRYESTRTDSPVFSYVDNYALAGKARPARQIRDRTFNILDKSGKPIGKKIGFKSGHISQLTPEYGRAVDFWVNSENNSMQMARVYEASISSTIRSLGAHDLDDLVLEKSDTIQVELRKAMKGRRTVEAGEIVVTPSGKLLDTHRVQAIFHAASVTGIIGKGWRSLGTDDLSDIVIRTIDEARKLLVEGAYQGKSIVFPMFGTGQAGVDPSKMLRQLVEAAIIKLSQTRIDLKEGDLETVYFLAYSKDHVSLMRRVFSDIKKDGLIEKTDDL